MARKKRWYKRIKFGFHLSLLGFLVVLGVVGALVREQESRLDKAREELVLVKQELEDLKNQDQVKINEELKERIAKIEETYQGVVELFDNINDFEDRGIDTGKLDKMLASAVSNLSKTEYEKAQEEMDEMSREIAAIEAEIAAAAAAEQQKQIAATTLNVSNTAPSSGYSRQAVDSDVGRYTVSMIAADYGSTKVIVDTASSGDCGNDCPVLSLGEYVARNGAYAGVNGSYFCPASYASCAGKTNTFDLLVMNKDKHYFNSDNNVYSNNPAVIFGGSFIRFVGAASQWGRDTSIDSMLSNYPLLVSGSNVVFNGDGDPKKGSKGNRSFVGQKGNTVYIGVVHNVTVAESAHVLQALGLENALNLDSGGSTALWSGGYKLGPGRNIPNAILFVSR